jgi:polyisoprenyl-teichoic acid--peptidoglycan teichoic acid transferase
VRRLIPKSRGGSLIRFAIAGVIVIAFTATTTAVAGLLQFKQFVADISLTPPIAHANVEVPHPGHPQTILIIGSDHRLHESFKQANTDTMMLMRIDANSSTINVLSVPRDLRVQIPEGATTVTSKINAAYSLGGPNLLVKVLKQQVFPGLQINHIVDINFGGFESVVDAIGCVYTDVDHRYYNNTALTDYSSIDLQPGYQRLCGADALSFVRFRHTDSDIVRNARQQDFLRWAKAQFNVGRLFSQRDRFLKIFGKHTQTDPNLHSLDGLINLFNLVAFSAGHSIKQVPFPAQFLPCSSGVTTATGAVVGAVPCYVIPTSPGAERAAYAALMRPTRGGSKHSNKPHKPHKPASIANAAVTGDASDGQAQAAALGPHKLAIYYPRVIANNSKYCTNETCSEGPIPNSYPRFYRIRARDGNRYPAYRMTLQIDNALGEYYGVQGTTWLKAPILGSPGGNRTIDGKHLMLYYAGSKLALVAWKTGGAVYWISNTLTQNLTNSQMLAIASSLTRAK